MAEEMNEPKECGCSPGDCVDCHYYGHNDATCKGCRHGEGGNDAPCLYLITARYFVA